MWLLSSCYGHTRWLLHFAAVLWVIKIVFSGRGYLDGAKSVAIKTLLN